MDYKHHDKSLQNLLTGTSWDAWSNSLLAQGRTVGQQSNSYDVGAAILDNDGTAIGDWNGTTTRCTVAVGAGIFTITDDGTGTTMETSVDLAGLTVGALYKFSATLDNGTGTWAVGAGAGLQVEPNGGGANIAYVASETEVGFESYSLIWEATEVDNRITFVADVGAGETVDFDDVYVIQVTPGCIAADALGPDGWYKDTTLDVFREHNGANTKDRSFYALKAVSGAADDFLIPFNGLWSTSDFLARYAGQTVTMGLWVKASDASHVRLWMHDSVDDAYSGYHTGGGAYEWLEITYTVESAATLFQPIIQFRVSGKTAYISQPQLSFASSIGEGNYSRPPGEIIWFEQDVASSLLDGLTTSDVNFTDLNLEADSDGKIGKGVKAVYAVGRCNDSGSAGDDGYLRIRPTSGEPGVFWSVSARGLANDSSGEAQGWISCGANGDFEYNVGASGVNTLDISILRYVGIQLR